MNFKKISTVLLAVFFVALVSCRTNPVLNVTDAPVVASGSKYSEKDVKSAIIKAGQSLGWGMKETKPGTIVGTLFVRNHMAKVEVTYSKKTYSINYKDSAGLNYDGSEVHRNYNNWVKNLEGRINSYLSSL